MCSVPTIRARQGVRRQFDATGQCAPGFWLRLAIPRRFPELIPQAMIRIAACLLLVLAAAVASAAEGAPAKSSALEAAELVYDGGRVARGTKLAHTFLLKNVGAAELSVDAKPG